MEKLTEKSILVETEKDVVMISFTECPLKSTSGGWIHFHHIFAFKIEIEILKY